MSDSEFADTRHEYQGHAEKLRITQGRFMSQSDLKQRTATLNTEREQISSLEKSFQYLEATYETLVPGDKRENRSKMEACRKEYLELRQ